MRPIWLILICSVLIVFGTVPIHELVHVNQCFQHNGTPRFTFIYTKGYDFFNWTYGDILPSPAIGCTLHSKEDFDSWESHDDWYFEFPAFFVQGFVITILIVISIRYIRKRYPRGRTWEGNANQSLVPIFKQVVNG